MTWWLGKDERGGVPSEARPDATPPTGWRFDAIFAAERPHHLAVSPDGSHIAFVLDRDGTTDVWVVPSAGGAPRRLTTDRILVAFWDDAAPIWSPAGDRVVYGNGGWVCVVPIAGGPPHRLIDGSPAGWLDDDRLVVVVERERCTRLAVIEIADPWPQPFGPSHGDVSSAAVAGDGTVVATFWPKDERNRSDIIAAAPGGDWRVLVGEPDRRAMGPAVHGTTVAYLQEENDRAAVYTTDLSATHRQLLAKADADFGSLSWNGDGTRLVATSTARGSSDLVTIDRNGAATIASGGSWQTPGWAGAAIVAVYESAQSPPAIVRVGEDGAHSEIHDGTPAAIRSAHHVGFERVTYRSRDGLEIEGFLFRPDHEGPVPAVVYPHGGPTSHCGDEWDGYAQYFVAKGYAWFAINFRGSTSYGVAFERANHGDWGVGDVEDCLAAARHLASLGWVDPSRIAVFGASYGSYLALASLVHPDNPFACGVAKYGDCDILTSWAQGDREGGDDLERMMGHPSANRAAYLAGSPIHSIDQIDRPILIAHGERDRRVHPKQSEELVEALARLGRTYEYVTYPTEGHGLLRREPQIHFYQRLERFLDWHLM